MASTASRAWSARKAVAISTWAIVAGTRSGHALKPPSDRDRMLPRTAGRSQAVPATLLGWTWAGSLVGNLVFFDRPWVAVYGGVAMGVLVVPYLLSLLRRDRV